MHWGDALSANLFRTRACSNPACVFLYSSFGKGHVASWSVSKLVECVITQCMWDPWGKAPCPTKYGLPSESGASPLQRWIAPRTDSQNTISVPFKNNFLYFAKKNACVCFESCHAFLVLGKWDFPTRPSEKLETSLRIPNIH